VHRDLTRFEVHGRPSEPTHLAAANSGCQLEEEQRRKPVAPNRGDKRLNVVGRPHLPARSGDLGRLDVARRVVGDVLPGDGVNQCAVIHRVDVPHRLGRQARRDFSGDDAGLVAPDRRARRVDRGVARRGNRSRRRNAALGELTRPVCVHVGVAVPFNPALCEELPIELE
jgi:hypothetical protein